MEREGQRLTDLRNGLLRLHKTLMESEREVYERDVERINTSAQLLNLLMHDPWFGWLHELSEMVVRIDEMLVAEEPPKAEETDVLIAQARALVSPSENGQGFGKHYFEAMQRDPDVVLAHAATIKLLSALGRASPGGTT